MEGLLLVEPNRGVKQKFEGLYEALTKKHAKGYAKLMKQFEEIRAFSCHHHHHHICMHNALETNHDDVLVIKPTDQNCHHEERIHLLHVNARLVERVRPWKPAEQAWRVLSLVRSLVPSPSSVAMEVLADGETAALPDLLSESRFAGLGSSMVFPHLNSPPDSS